MCLYPKIIKNRKYVSNKKNDERYGEGNVPIAKDKRCLYVPIGCGNCVECRKQKARGWQVRLSEDLRVYQNAKFLTFTFNDYELQKLDNEIKGLKGYERDNEICRLAVRRFTERWRKEFGKSVRHWMVTELGSKYTERIHMHGLLWTDEKMDVIQEKWKYGRVILGNGKGEHYVSEKTVNYIVKYISKVDEKHKYYKSKMFVSNGIGKSYMDRDDIKRNKYNGEETIETYKTRTGMELGLPIYYRNHIYSEEERENLWINKLDKQERWVLGQRIDVSENEDEYVKALKYAQMKNKRLGYEL
jgi:hypothetical protein